MKKLYGGKKAENESRKKTTSFSSYSIFFKRRVTDSCGALKLKSGRRKEVLDMFFFSFYCDGLRFSDILTLEWDCIDMDAQLLRKCQCKTRQEVTVPLSPTAMDILRRWSGDGNDLSSGCWTRRQTCLTRSHCTPSVCPRRAPRMAFSAISLVIHT